MADVKWIGGAPAKAEVQTATIGGTWANGETITATVGGRSITVTLGATSAASVTAVANALKAAWNNTAASADETWDFDGDDFEEMSGITLTSSTGNLTFTADTAGIPFTVTLSETSTSGTVSSMTIATAATGPNDWANKRNWSTNTVPVNSDIVFFEDSDIDVLYGLDQSAVSLTALHIHSTYTGNIGLDSMRDRGEDTEHKEYRRLALKLGGTVVVYIGKGDGEGSSRIRIEFNAGGTAYVYSTGDSTVDGHPALFLTGGSSAGANIYGGSVWIGGEGGDAINFSSIVISGTEDDTPEVTIGHEGSGTTTGITASNATVFVDSSSGTLNVYAGATVTLASAWTAGSIVMKGAGGVLLLTGPTKALANVTVADVAHFDASGFLGGVTISGAFTCYAGAIVTFTEGGSRPDITLAAGVGIAGTGLGQAYATLNLPLTGSSDIIFTGL